MPETRRTQLTNQARDWGQVKTRLDALRTLLATRRETYRRLDLPQQAKWRENPKDPVLNGAWRLLNELAEFFDVEVR